MVSHRERFTEIVSVLGKYGFGHIYNTHVKPENKDQNPKNLRLAFEELGPSFIKNGQIKNLINIVNRSTKNDRNDCEQQNLKDSAVTLYSSATVISDLSAYYLPVR